MTSTRKPSSKKTPRSSGPAGPSYPAPIQDTALNAAQRERALEEMSSAEGLDVLVVGGGVTGAGIALDAAARGLRTGIVEMGDWASGTSSWSSKLVHGGLRYLYQLNFALVHEALTERGRLLSTTAPHLVKAQPFLWPLKHHYERSYSAVGVGMYDALALAGSRGRKTVPIQRHLGRKGTSALAPSLDTSGLAGSIRFFDARVDDARLVIDLVRTAVGLGALAANRTKVTGFLTDERGHVHGARVTDLATGQTHEIRAKRTINAAGVWTEDVGVLSQDFLTAITDIDTQWEKVAEGRYRGVTAEGKELFGTRDDLVFGSNSELRTLSEVYAADDAKEKFVRDFVAAWVKVMDADRFDARRAAKESVAQG